MEVSKENILSGDIEQFRSLLKVSSHHSAEWFEYSISSGLRRLIAAYIHDLSREGLDWSTITSESFIAGIESNFPDLRQNFKDELAFSIKVLDSYFLSSHLDESLNTSLEKLRTALLIGSVLQENFC